MKLITISATSARWASWALESHLHHKRRCLADLRAENNPGYAAEIDETEDDIAMYTAAYTQLREQLTRIETSVFDGEVSMACKTPGAHFDFHISHDYIAMSVALPYALHLNGLREDEAKRIEDTLHNACEAVVNALLLERVDNPRIL